MGDREDPTPGSTELFEQPSETEPAIRLRRYSADASGDILEVVDEDGTVIQGVRANGEMRTNGGSVPGVLCSKSYLFTEEATSKTYTVAHPVEARTFIAEVALYMLAVQDPGNVGWAADAAPFTIGDSHVADGYSTGLNLAGFSTLYDPFNTPGTGESGAGMYGMNGLSGTYSNSALNAIGEGAQSSGLYYPDADTITMTVVTTNAAPVVPAGVTLFRIYWFAPVAAVPAVVT